MAVLTEKTTARVKNGVAYYEGESFSISNVDKVKVLDFSGYAYKDSLTYSRNNNDLIVSYYGANVTIKDYFGANGTVASTVKTIRTYDNSTKKRYKDYNLVTSGFLNNINSGVENFGIKKGVITGTPFADTISAADFSNPTGKGKDIGVTIKTGLGNDTITGSNYKDTFEITGSGMKTINIGSDDADDIIKGVNTKDVSLDLNISGAITNYEQTGNDLTISATGTKTTIKDYFKNPAAPAVKLNNNSLINILNQTDLVNIDKSTQTGKQTITGTFLNNVITGGYGTDIINLVSSDTVTGDRVNAGKGNDTINIKGPGKKIITIANEDGNDTITGTATAHSYTHLDFTDIDVDSVTDAKNNLTYTRNKNNLVIKRTYVVDGTTKTSTTTIKDYFKNKASTPSVYFGDGSNTYVSLFSVLNGFNAGTKGSHLSDTLTGTRKNDKITTGAGTDTITGGRGNDKITVDGHGNKYVIMNTGDGTDTLDIKTTDSVYLQFTGANITNDTSARNNLTYQKSGKNDLKITSKVESNAIVAPRGYISNSGINTDKITFYFTTGTHSYYTEITEDTGLYSYEANGETRYTTVKNETKALSSAKIIIDISKNNTVGFLTDSTNYDSDTWCTVTSLSDITTLYAYLCKNYTGNYEYAYSASPVTATKYSELWLKSNGSSGQYDFVREYTDGCIEVNSRTSIYVGNGFVSLERMYEGQEEVSQSKYNSTYFIDNKHLQVVDIDNNSGTPIYKAFTVSNSYYLKLPDNPYYNENKGMAVTSALTEASYTKINNIYKTTGSEGNVTYSIKKPAGFKEKTDSTSVIVKDYLSKDKYVYITNSNSTTSRSLANIVNGIGINIGNEKSRKAQKLTGTRMDDNIHGGSKNDKITTGRGTDTITGGKGNDKITIDGYGTKYIVMNNGDGTDTLDIKNQSTSTYIQFKGANNSQNINPLTDLTYQKSGKNDLKITYSDAPSKKLNNLSGLYFYDKYGQSDFIMFNDDNMYSESSDYFTDVSSTGLYSYENEDGKTSYSTNKTETIALNTVYFEMNGWSYKDGVGYLTTTPHEDTGYSATALSGVQKVYAYKNTISPSYTPNGKPVTEIIYTIDSNVTPKKYSDLWLKPQNDGYSDYYYVIVTSKETDDCIRVSDQEALYTYDLLPSYYGDGRIYLDDNGGLPLFITSDKYDSVYYFDHDHSYITDIDNDSTNGLYKEYTVSDSYFLARNGEGEEVEYLQQGDATTKALTASDYTQINTIYSSKDADGNLIYSVVKPQGFSTKSTDTSIIIKNYLKESPYVVINGETNINLDTIMGYLGLNIGNANSKKAQKLTGSRFDDNIYGGSGKDKITTGTSSNGIDKGDIINPGKGNDTVTIDGYGDKTINIANNDGNDTIIFTDNNKNTSYDYTTYKMLYLNYENDAALTYNMKGKDLVIKRTYAINSTKQGSATTTLKNYFNAEYQHNLSSNIVINGTVFDASNYFNNSTIDKSAGKKSQKINGNLFNNTIIGGSGNDTINGCGGNDTMDGKNGSDTYVVNYNSGSKYYLYDTIIINDSGDGAKDVDTLKLDIKKKDLGLLFNLNKITNPNAYTDNDIVVGSGNDAIHYLMDDQWMIVTNFSSLDDVEINSEKVTMEHGIYASGLEKITTSDKKNITLADIKTIAQDVANWLSTEGYDSTAAVYNGGGNSDDLLTMLAKYNPDNAALKEYLNAD